MKQILKSPSKFWYIPLSETLYMENKKTDIVLKNTGVWFVHMVSQLISIPMKGWVPMGKIQIA